MALSPSDPRPSLTNRDVVLLRCLATGASTAHMAAALAVSSNTARTRLRRIQGKLGVSSRSQLVLAARTLDLL